ncbi:hypothetical protein EUX98_g4489 [Antrodiella citrinella]|uniref:HAT C-terminal dimerisation domain-containing protein n=1 Tax=Antrodiella citrinella TaxID=2447956 RepID=A0A4S4MWD4_9APHY|nr:hypothetical protein EUX98_g4489 [Antrodiella citrinella]
MSDSQPPEKRKRDQTKYFESLKSLKPNAHILKPTTKSSSKSAASSTASSVAPPSLSAPIRPRAASVRTEDEDDAELNKTADEIIEIGSDDDAMEVDPEKDNEDPKEELKRLQSEWTAPVYAFFKPEVEIVMITDTKSGKERRAHKFRCNGTGCKVSITRYLDKSDRKSTGNLNTHVRKCKAWGEGVLAAAREAKTVSAAREGLAKFTRNGTLPSAFKRVGKGKESYSTRQLTASEMRAEIVRWVAEDLRPFKIVSDRGFLKLMKTGRPEIKIPSPSTVARDVHQVFARSRQRIADMLNAYEGELSFATDCWTSPNHHFAEDLELETEDLLDVGDLLLEEDGGVDDGDDVEGWEDAHDQLNDEDRREHEEDVIPLKRVLVKLRKTAFAMINSSTKLLPSWKKILAELKLKLRKMPRDVATRWNSTYVMLQFAVEYREGLEALTGDRANGLREVELDEEEWGLVTELRDVLKVFYDTTLYFSASTPTIAQVIPAMDMIDKHLATASINPAYCTAIRTAAKLAKVTLNRYYSKTDMADIYRIAMILHPRHKLEYFKTAGWEAEWISTAKALAYKVYDDDYAGRPMGEEQPTTTASSVASTSSTSRNVFDAMLTLAPIQSSAAGTHELDIYLQERLADIPASDDALLWWYDRRSVFPRLSRMARDFLTIPATSVDVERIFSKGRLLLSHVRNGLTARSTRALICLHYWSKKNIIKDEDVVKIVLQPPVPQGTVFELEDGWDEINISAYRY